jgi:D-aminoacyl-tRNA deacylase
MRAVISRVCSASVTVDTEVVAAFTEPGLLVLLAVGLDDDLDSAATMARKIAELRLLREDRSVLDAGAPVLVVSQFTLYGDTRRGRRPSWSAAARPTHAKALVEAALDALRERGVRTYSGRFGADMAVASVNDGPFTVLVET